MIPQQITLELTNEAGRFHLSANWFVVTAIYLFPRPASHFMVEVMTLTNRPFALSMPYADTDEDVHYVGTIVTMRKELEKVEHYKINPDEYKTML